jgi:hypothetical protein
MGDLWFCKLCGFGSSDSDLKHTTHLARENQRENSKVSLAEGASMYNIVCNNNMGTWTQCGNGVKGSEYCQNEAKCSTMFPKRIVGPYDASEQLHEDQKMFGWMSVSW